jgi:uncharacterized protein YcbX
MPPDPPASTTGKSPAGAWPRVELRDGLLRGPASRRFHLVLTQDLEARSSGDRTVARLHSAVAHGHALNVQASAHLVVGCEHAVRIGNENAPTRVANTNLDLADLGPRRAGRLVGQLQQRNLSLHVDGVTEVDTLASYDRSASSDTDGYRARLGDGAAAATASSRPRSERSDV